MNFFKTFLAALLAFFVAYFLMIILTVMLFAGIASMFGGQTAITVKPGSVLHIDLSGGVVDSPQSSPIRRVGLGGIELNSSNTILDMVTAIERAAYDNKISGVYIDMTKGGSISHANVEELRAALEEFKKVSGKFVIGYGETYSQFGYYLSSVADKVYMNPEGMMEWTGLSSMVTFFKGTMDKLGVKADIIRHGSFKAAAEPFMLNKMSSENRMQLDAMLGSIWGSMLEEISKSRSIEASRLFYMASGLMIDSPQSALESKMIDGLMYEDEVMLILKKMASSSGNISMEEIINELPAGRYNGGMDATSSPDVNISQKTDDDNADKIEETMMNPIRGRKKSSVAPPDGNRPKFVSISDYISYTKATADGRPKDRVGIVYIDGNIVDGSGSMGSAGSADVAARLSRARYDDRVKAVVVRVNSPGGSALASEVMWREVELLRKEKPVVVSMGEYAASGGYYVSAPADVILSNRYTVTGSIGVFGMHFNFAEALDNKLGITFDVVNTNHYSDFASPLRPLEEREREVLTTMVENIYSTFVGHVAEGRNMTKEDVDRIGGGRIWSGVDALDIGLVDGFGGIMDAVKLAASRAGIAESYRVWEITEKPNNWSFLLQSMLASVLGSTNVSTGSDYDEAVEYYINMKKLVEQEQDKVQALMPYRFDIR